MNSQTINLIFLTLILIALPITLSTLSHRLSLRSRATDPLPPSTLPSGLYSLTDWSATPDPRIWSHPDVDGVVIRAYWRDLNPALNQYSWAYLDTIFDQAQKSSKKVRLAIAPGFYSPAWVLDQVPTAPFPVPQGPLKGQSQPLPIPWDSQYLNLWFKFIDALATRYGSSPALSYIAVTGPNSHNGEVNLPNSKTDSVAWIKLAHNSAAQLQTQLEQAYFQTLDHFHQSFGTQGKYFTVSLITNSFRLLTGFQIQALTNLYSCDNLAPTSILQQALTTAVNFKAHFVELYQSEFFDPAKASLLHQPTPSWAAPQHLGHFFPLLSSPLPLPSSRHPLSGPI
ncbi:MAG: hypothetical protein A2784_02195 [Candidatus Chisholmbacteria bacterium RIFCSPHIGHO2_01_FULL_48_12]|uniref:Glycoside hydrolase family 42 N-terminal domain-containing protein n=1 Tax=Candidatus Chisholmbacteria bacterium RIFCSPHIGHO2_01_FULL_48_12 TaxID=1797589 RepID=A0A1G1VLJ1_9BACT|nr:MAG: hypothetical protein A2784_02195 [Candidatus Chisholmbacteria bacterium RIFCSPHIGHO2_01_FULL_48_12]